MYLSFSKTHPAVITVLHFKTYTLILKLTSILQVLILCGHCLPIKLVESLIDILLLFVDFGDITIILDVNKYLPTKGNGPHGNCEAF